MSQYYPEEWLEELTSKLDIVDVIGDYVQLKPKGKNHWGICPFHGEKTPSFSVDSEKQLYYCFGCHKGGNMFRFVMDIENISFQEAAERLAEKAHIPLPQFTMSNEHSNLLKEKKEKLYMLQKDAAHHFHNNLSEKDSKRALEYLGKRKINIGIIKNFGIGYAKEGWDDIKNVLQSKYDTELLVEAGLIGKKNDKTYDYFRDRIIFPIIDLRGNVVGFGGRVLGDDSPKYLNSPDSIIFNKKNILYGLNFALKKNRPLSRLIIVEGYIDVISLHKVGFTEAVATLGTAFAASHAKLIKRYTDNVYVAYDGDNAGQTAILRSIEILLENGLQPKIIKLADKKDPDEFISAYGAQAFEKAISSALTYMDFKLDMLKSEYDLSTQENRMQYATAAIKLISKINNAIERDRYISRINIETGYGKEVLKSQIANEMGIVDTPKSKKAVNVILEAENIKKQQLDNIKAEKYIICMMSKNEEDRALILKHLKENDLTLPLCKQLFAYIAGRHENNLQMNTSTLLTHYSEDDSISEITEIINYDIPDEKRIDFIIDCINCIKMAQIEDNMKKIMQQLGNNPDKNNRQSLLNEYRELDKQLKKLHAHNTEEV